MILARIGILMLDILVATISWHFVNTRHATKLMTTARKDNNITP